MKICLVCKIICCSFFTAYLISCTSINNPYTNSLGIPPSEIAQIDTANYTTIAWEDSVQNIGTVISGDTILINFKFKNTGKGPLFITGVSPDCGCTIINYPKDLIPSGKHGSIAVSFAADISHGGAFVRRHISVRTNTRNGIYHHLVFYCQVKEDSSMTKKMKHNNS